jgi:AraC-like DNA-binding protein
VIGELAQAVVDERSSVSLDEAGMLFAERFAEVVSGCNRRRSSARRLSAMTRDRRRAVAAAMSIDERCQQEIDLGAVAGEVGLSSFHFLRQFSQVLGVTPHQYLVRSRLRRAARLLADDNCSITGVASEAGFGDVSNFAPISSHGGRFAATLSLSLARK